MSSYELAPGNLLRPLDDPVIDRAKQLHPPTITLKVTTRMISSTIGAVSFIGMVFLALMQTLIG